jgi:hypothetical protein
VAAVPVKDMEYRQEISLTRDSSDRRRRDLGMPFRVLSERSGVSMPVVQRLLAGKISAPRFPSVVAVGKALGLDGVQFLDDGSISFGSKTDARVLRERQARTKARRLVGMVQGTSALEGQAVSAAASEEMVERTYHELLSGSNHRLWSE